MQFLKNLRIFSMEDVLVMQMKQIEFHIHSLYLYLHFVVHIAECYDFTILHKEIYVWYWKQ